MSLRWPHEIVYQIFPERFADGNPSLTVRNGETTWLGHPVLHSKKWKDLTRRLADQYTFFGGDLPGIKGKIPYLKELGITAVYLNPIFAAQSTHKYDTDDYFRIDPHFGGEEDFRALVDDLHAAGMKLILDGVFNHTSFEHPWYRKAKEAHYSLKPDGTVRTWMDGGTLPKLDVDRPEVGEALAEVVAYWKGVDAWRLDASHLLSSSFLRRLRGRFEAVNPEGLIIGEEWEHAGAAIRDGLYDGVTNFLFRKPLLAFFQGDLAVESLVRRLSLVPETYPWHGVVQSWNFLDNHDTDRFWSAIDQRLDRLRVAVGLLFSFPGTPLILYGDEVGMTGRSERETRAPMIWEPARQNRSIQALYRHWIQLRKSHPVLATGSLTFLQASNREGTFAFARESADERALVLVNAGERDRTIQVEGVCREIEAGSVEVFFS